MQYSLRVKNDSFVTQQSQNPCAYVSKFLGLCTNVPQNSCTYVSEFHSLSIFILNCVNIKIDILLISNVNIQFYCQPKWRSNFYIQAIEINIYVNVYKYTY